MEIRKTFKAELAHRVTGAYTQRCQGIHGHSYQIEVVLASDSLDPSGMIVDFKEVKDLMGDFIDSFDHTLLVWNKDLDLVSIASRLNPRYMIVPYNPTAENMALHILEQLINDFADRECVDIEAVIVHETATGYAKAYPGDISMSQFDMAEVVYSDQIKKEWKNGGVK